MDVEFCGDALVNSWTWQIWFSIFGGGALFVSILLPLLVLQMRRYGGVSARRLLGAAAVSVYGVALVSYTLLPLPDLDMPCRAASSLAEWVPGHSLDDVVRETAGLTPFATLTSRSVFQVIMNVFLFVPLGVLSRRYWNCNVLIASLLGAAVSVAIEATQLTGIWGVYGCAYRVADVDDVIANTLGAALGAALAPLVLWWMPNARELRSVNRLARPVTVWRRWFGMLLDAVFIQIVGFIVAVVITGVQLLFLGETFRSPISVPSVSGVAFSWALTICLAVFLPSILGSGASVGQRLVWLAPYWPEGHGSRIKRLMRGSVVGVPFIAAQVLEDVADAVGGAFVPVAGMAGIASGLVVLASILSVLLTRDCRGLSFALVGADLRDVRADT